MGGWDAPWHWIVLAVLVIALFGYKRLPDAARSMGRSMRIFKTEIKGMGEDDKRRAEARDATPAAPPAVEGGTPAAAAPQAASAPTQAVPTVPTTDRDGAVAPTQQTMPDGATKPVI